MATVAYQTGDRRDGGVVLELVVSDDVAEALAEPEPRLKEVVFSVLAGGRRKGADQEPAADVVSRLTQEDGRRRHNGKALNKPGMWEGPRFRFDLFLGDSRAGWTGGPVFDELGRCAFCRGEPLAPFVYCLGCDACGREREIPPASPTARSRAHAALRAALFGTDGLQGGKGEARRMSPEAEWARKARAKFKAREKALAKGRRRRARR